jgi:hypothetical protein
VKKIAPINREYRGRNGIMSCFSNQYRLDRKGTKNRREVKGLITISSYSFPKAGVASFFNGTILESPVTELESQRKKQDIFY